MVSCIVQDLVVDRVANDWTETKAHDFPDTLWPNVKDPATEHPMSARIVQILETYKQLYKETGKEQPLLKNARYVGKQLRCTARYWYVHSFITPQEAIAAGEQGCHSATISHTVLNQLAKLEYDPSKQPGEGVKKPAHVYKNAGPTPARLQKLLTIDPLAPPNWDGKLARTDVDYLANGGKRVDECIAADPAATQRLKDALELFTGGEKRSQEKVEKVLATL
jgi:transaldolase